MQKTISQLFFILMCLGYSLSGVAQEKISGRIVDEQGNGLDAVVVMLASETGNQLLETSVTDSMGMFHLPMHKGHYLLCVRALGYKELKKTISITASAQLLDLKLEPDEIALNNVVVTARKMQPVTTYVNGKIQINVGQSYLSDMGNALEVLKHSPGITVNHQGEVSLASLGGTVIYINGRKLMMQGTELSNYLRTLSASKIARIETSPNPNASYGSDGAGGIINIILKSSMQAGFYLTTSHSVECWKNLRQNSDVAFSYNTSKWQLELNYSHSIGHHTMRYGYYKLQNGDKSLSTTEDIDKRNTYSVGLDVVWQPNPKNKLFFNSALNGLVGPGETQTTTDVYRGTANLDGVLMARNNYLKQKNMQYNNSLNYQYNPTDRQQISLTFDWTHFDGEARCEQPNEYYSVDNMLLRSELYHSQPDKDINVCALLADYKFNPNKQNELLVGLKTSMIESHNTFLFKHNDVLDTQRSNRFKYNEKNIEGYAQYTHKWSKLELSGGLRMEYMYTHNRLNDFVSQQVEENKMKHLRLFPNLLLSYNINEKSKMALLYSRRQDKPRYEDLNPFEYLLDELSYWKGNPFLEPQISNKVMVSYTWDRLSVNVYFNKLDNYFTSLTDVYDNDKTIMTTKNIGTQQQIGMEAIYTKRLQTWWDMSANIGGYYFINNLDYELYRQKYKRPSCFLSVSNNILLPFGLNLELSARYYSKRQGGSYEVSKPTGGVDIGLNKAWHNDKMRLSFLATDIFHTERWDSYGSKDALNIASWGYGESRKLILRFSYRFGKQKFIKAKKEIEELKRL